MELRLLKRTWNLFQGFHRFFFVSLVVLLAQEIINILPGFIWGRAVNTLSEHGSVMTFIKLNFAIYFTRVVHKAIEDLRDRYEKNHIDFAVPLFARMRVLRYLACELPLGVLRGQHSGQTQGVIETGEANISTLMQNILFRLIPAIMGIAITSIVTMLVDWRFGCITIAGSVAMSLIIHFTNVRYKKRQHEINEKRNRVTRYFSDILKHLALVRIFSKEKETADQLEIESNDLNQDRKKLQKPKRSLSRFAWVVMCSANMAVYHLAGLMILKKEMSIGEMVMFMSWSGTMQNYIQDLTMLNTEWAEMLPMIKKYFSILDLGDCLPKPQHDRTAKEGDIHFSEVSFFYPKYKTLETEEGELKEKEKEKKSHMVLKKISFVAERGKMTALVGRSGVGKTTVFSLINGSYPPVSGQVTLAEDPIERLVPQSIHSLIGYVPQLATLFDKPLRWHFELAGKHVTEEMIWDIAKRLDMEDHIKSLPDGLDTRLGDGGSKISGGQRQRVVLMMALLKNPRILLLDEPTNNLDPESQRLVKKEIERWKEESGGTVIVIAHHMDTIQKADKVIVLEKGEIAGTGTHHELLESCEEYRTLNQNENLVVG